MDSFQVIILVGGKGTRIQKISNGVPKPMMRVAKKPFLYHVMEKMEREGATKIVLACGYGAEYVKERVLTDAPVKIPVEFSIESVPLGTGGAIKLATHYIDKHKFLAINGDSIFDISVCDFIDYANSLSCDFCLAGVEVEDVQRYGALDLDAEGRVVGMSEKCRKGSGVINSGIYYLSKNVLESIKHVSFSFEIEVLHKRVGEYFCWPSSGYFIDIGIPEDYYKADSELFI